MTALESFVLLVALAVPAWLGSARLVTIVGRATGLAAATTEARGRSRLELPWTLTMLATVIAVGLLALAAGRG